MSRKHLPAAVAVSIGCSVARNATPFGSQLPHDVLQVADRAGYAVDARDHHLPRRSRTRDRLHRGPGLAIALMMSYAQKY
jgi:hypothetical protein